MGKILVKDPPTWMAQLEDEVNGSGKQVTEAGLMVGKHVKVKSQVPKIIEW